ncbi:hypothetical protein CDCA_CDCA06G1864 [Cyanidium caldarium]|uniref:N(6)-L-threonylcarbamoyladenine synthase n=1 Tax=Cyanidium caldarium TaxID=2771 RepID=A0AAV9IUC2_CYACA|nr:hypothetical protein CDCA_CDCA06G1864 [Cyanidium caldarium]
MKAARPLQNALAASPASPCFLAGYTLALPVRNWFTRAGAQALPRHRFRTRLHRRGSCTTAMEADQPAEPRRRRRALVGLPKGIDYTQEVPTSTRDPLAAAAAARRVSLERQKPSRRGFSLALPTASEPIASVHEAAAAVSSCTHSDNSRLVLPPEPFCVLGIETSCDDTAAAVVRSDGTILAEHVVRQDEIHAAHGGVVPGLARDAHRAAIDRVIEWVLRRAFHVGESDDPMAVAAPHLAAVATTMGPGLEICLRVGFHAARQTVERLRALQPASSSRLPLFLSMHHLEAHCLVARRIPPHEPPFPFLVLLASGGHCMLLLARDLGQYSILGGTLDDSIGEAYDKTARLLGLEWGGGGGPALERLAREGNPHAFSFSVPLRQRRDCNFSFAGLKTAVRLAIEKCRRRAADIDEAQPLVQLNRQAAADIAASFQYVAVKHLEERLSLALQWCQAHEPNVRSVVVAGGVAANATVRERLRAVARQAGWTRRCPQPDGSMRDEESVLFPPPRLCTDNGVMVAWAGVERVRRCGDIVGEPDMEDIEVAARWPMGARVDMSGENGAAQKR